MHSPVRMLKFNTSVFIHYILRISLLFFPHVMAEKSKRTTLPIRTKFDIVRQLSNSGATQSSISAQYNIPRSTVTKIWKNKEEITNLVHNEHKLSAKRIRCVTDVDIAEALYEWFKQKSLQGARISAPILIEKAKQIALADDREFTPSSSWIQRWKKRHDISWKKEEGEKQDADYKSAEDWITFVLPDLLGQFNALDIFNADETALYYRGFPDRGYGMKNDKLCGGKKAKDRITVLVCANMAGDEKCPLLVIGKSKKPRCFPKNLTNLPVLYRSSKNAWMTAGLFCEWLELWDRQLTLKQRKILLLVDNCSAHSKHPKVVNITLRFLPPNTTSIIQPMDMGIIQNLKTYYRSKLNSRIITALDADTSVTALQVSRSVSLLDALYLIREAWTFVKVETINNCYRKGGFKVSGETLEVIAPEDNIPIPHGMSLEDFQETVDMDKDAEVCGELDDLELLDVIRSKRSENNLSDSNSDDPDCVETMEDLNPKDVLEALNILRSYAQQHGENDQITLRSIEEKLNIEILHAKKQSRIETFFHK